MEPLFPSFPLSLSIPFPFLRRGPTNTRLASNVLCSQECPWTPNLPASFLCKHWDCSVPVLPAAQFMQCWRWKPGSVCSRQAHCQLLRLPQRSCVPMQICPVLDLGDYLLHWTFTLFFFRSGIQEMHSDPFTVLSLPSLGCFLSSAMTDALVLLLWNRRFTHAFPRRGDAECSV